jgi:hypothetical protein
MTLTMAELSGLGGLGGNTYERQAGGWVKVTDQYGNESFVSARRAARMARAEAGPAGEAGPSADTQRRDQERERGEEWWGVPGKWVPDGKGGSKPDAGMHQDPPMDPRTGRHVRNMQEYEDLKNWMEENGVTGKPPKTRDGWKAKAEEVRAKRKKAKEKARKARKRARDKKAKEARRKAKEAREEARRARKKKLREQAADLTASTGAGYTFTRYDPRRRTHRPIPSDRPPISELPLTAIRTYPSTPRVVRQAPQPPPPPPPPPVVSLAQQRYAAARAATLATQPAYVSSMPNYAAGVNQGMPMFTPGGQAFTSGVQLPAPSGVVNGLGRRPARHTLAGLSGLG